MKRIFPTVLKIGFLFVFTATGNANVLFLHHFDQGLDANHSQYGEPSATPTGGAALAQDGQGHPFEGVPPGRALDAGHSAPGNKDIAVRYPAVNLDSLRGTIEMWVKPNWSADPPHTRKTNRFHFLLSAPLENKGSLNIYYSCYAANSYTPSLTFHINNGKPLTPGEPGPDFIVGCHLAPDEKGNGLVWRKDVWHYLVVTWTQTTMRFFCDGKLMAERTFDKPMDIPRVAGPIWLGNSCGNWGNSIWPADALIDEMRITDSPLYEGKKEIPVPKSPLAREIKSEQVVAASGPLVMTKPDPRQYYCYQATTPPTIDGKLDDAIWQKIPTMSGFRLFGKPQEEFAPMPSEVKICRDEKFIYVAMFMYEEQMRQIKATATFDPALGKAPGVFADDDAEIFFGNQYGTVPDVQIGINSANLTCGILHEKDRSDLKWPGKFQTATGKTAEGWVVELAFPYSNLGPTPKVGDIWGFRACRSRSLGSASCINYGVGAYQVPADFLRLIMAGVLPDLNVAKEENNLNQNYIQAAREQMEAIAKEAGIQLAMAGDVPAEIREKRGLSAMEKDVRSFLEESRKLANGKQIEPVATWDRAFTALQKQSRQLEQFAYVLANAGGAQATLPPAGVKGTVKRDGIWYLASDQMAAAVEPKHGGVAGIWDRSTGQCEVVGGLLLYEIQTKDTTEKMDERTDQVVKVRKEKERLIVKCVNPGLPGLTITKTYFLTPVEGQLRSLARRVEISGRTKMVTLLLVSSRTLFDEEYRKPAYYHRIFAIGTACPSRTPLAAGEIAARIQQRAWFTSDEGRAQFALVNPSVGTGIAEYLYKENDAWTYPQSLPSSFWTPFGWDMGLGATFPKGKPYSFESRYHLFRGNRIAFHREYLGLPEYVALFTAAPPPKIAQLAGGMINCFVNQLIGGDDQPMQKLRENRGGRWAKDFCRPDEWMLGASAMVDRRWPDFPVGDDQGWEVPNANKPDVIEDQGRCLEVRKTLVALKQINPQLLTQTYDFVISIYKNGRTAKEHPEFIRIGRDGQPGYGWYGDSYYYANFTPEYVNYLIAGLLRSMDYYHFDICYLDFGPGYIVPDWGRGEVITIGVQLDFLRRLQAELHKRDKVLWLNSFQGQPYFDFGIFEALGQMQHWGRDWRDHADVVMMTKLYQPPGTPIMPLYWLGGDQFKAEGTRNETSYLDFTVGAGLTPSGCYLDPYDKSFPMLDRSGTDWSAIARYQIAVHYAAFELRHSAWAEAGLKNAWWDDPTSQLEIFTLKMPDDTHLANVISRHTTVADAAISVDLARMKFKPGKRTFVWQMLRRDYDRYPKGNPVPKNWNELFSSRVCASSIPDKTEFSYVIPNLPPDRLCVTEITQTPAAIVSVAGISTQTLLPATLGCSLTGDVDEKTRQVALQASCDKSCEVIAWWPKAWGNPKVVVGKQEVTAVPVSYGKEDFVRFAAEKGESNVAIEAK